MNGNYEPGTVVTMCYTMSGWNGTGFGSNWLEGFGLTLGPGWVSYVPVQEPTNCSNDGTWLWLESATSTSTGLVAGPGYFYEGPQGPVDGNGGNDWGDFGTTCQWTFCVQLQVTDECDPLSLLIGVTPYADGSMGSWTNESCFDHNSLFLTDLYQEAMLTHHQFPFKWIQFALVYPRIIQS